MKRTLIIAVILGVLLLGVVAGELPERARGRPNILLITVETLRRDHCSLYGHERDTTPFLRKLADESIVFDNAWSMSSWTYPSMACVLSGRGPEETGIWDAHNTIQGNLIPWLSQLCQEGYSTGTLMTNYWVKQLFDSGVEPAWAKSWRLCRAESLLHWTRKWLTDGVEEPWFLYWHIYDPHSVYEAPSTFRDMFGEGYSGPLRKRPLGPHSLSERSSYTSGEMSYITGRYDGEIRYVDHILGQLVQDLREAGQWQNTCLILTADHGESFGENGRWGHRGPLPCEQTQVPFLVRLPGGKRGGTRSDALVGGIDVLPTLLAQAGLPVPDDLPGVNTVTLLENPRPERTLVQHHLIVEWQDEGDVKYRIVGHTRGLLCGRRLTVEELPVSPDEAAPQTGEARALAGLRDLGYL